MKRSKPLKRSGRLRSVNRKRAKARKARGFGPYADWIRGRTCCLRLSSNCYHQVYMHEGLWRWSEAAHVKSRGAGGHAEANLVPLCTGHHAEMHTLGIKSFQAGYRFNLKAEATRLWAAYQSENGA